MWDTNIMRNKRMPQNIRNQELSSLGSLLEGVELRRGTQDNEK